MRFKGFVQKPGEIDKEADEEILCLSLSAVYIQPPRV